MMRSTTPAKAGDNRKGVRLWAVAVWLAVWQIASLAIGQEILLVSPVSVVLRLLELVRTAAFWRSIWFSLERIALGFFLAVLAGVVLAALSAWQRRVRELLAPLMVVIRATPVASFIILVLIWIPSRNLSVFISFLMVLPILYGNMLTGIGSMDAKLLEMARVFRVPFGRRLRYIYVAQVLPFFRAGCQVALGLCWKSGIAAEVIGIPRGSIGERLYQAKIYLDTPDLFAWTLVIILISAVFERVLLRLIDAAVARLERGDARGH